jgi:DNA mismatch repair protein MutS
MNARATPVMQQHAEAKQAHPDAIVFFRLGDFYEMFGEDAVVAARLLDLTLTSRNRGKPDEIPMAGVPHHAAHGYIARLLELGRRVAICEQMADPATVKGIVPRKVVRVITPGLVTLDEHLVAGANNFLAGVELSASGLGLSLLDLSTGELSAAVLPDGAALLAALSRARPREVLLGAADNHDGADELRRGIELSGGTSVSADAPLSESELSSALAELLPEALAIGALAARAAARALRFARACTPGAELPLRRIARWDPGDFMAIDRTAQQHLELVESAAGKASTLLSVIDETLTPPGARLLRRRLLAPLLDVARIRRRLDRVELFLDNSRLRGELREILSEVGDLERLATRASLGEATPRDLGALRNGLLAAARAVSLLESQGAAVSLELLGFTRDGIDVVSDLAETLAAALVERPPVQLKDGGIFQRGFDAELDELDALRRSGAERMVELEAQLREQTGISTLKVRYTRVFGWYIEVTRSQAGKVPDGFRRKQTVASGERYTTPELDDLADRITHAEDRHRERELGLLAELCARAKEHGERVRELSRRVARWDVAQGLAEVAHRYDYSRPDVDASDVLLLRDARHPVVERLAAAGRFVPNDVELSGSRERLWLVTGPNMAGKSTLLRQVALITILAQTGAYVPAAEARVGVVDRVLSRVGASDNVSRGESTFMVEMRETSEILRTATRRSLVILDEIGRGTSTFDGLSIAWAVLEYLDEAIGCRALFATHYHELVKLGEDSPHIANYSVSAREVDDDVVFLHRLVKGPASKSYGVAVARLAGLPESVLARARALLAELESGKAAAPRKKKKQEDQLDLFRAKDADPETLRALVDTLRGLELDRMTGLDALSLLARWKGKV